MTETATQQRADGLTLDEVQTEGFCPDCHRPPDHFMNDCMVCPECRVFWLVGPSRQDQTEERQRATCRHMQAEGYLRVEGSELAWWRAVPAKVEINN